MSATFSQKVFADLNILYDPMNPKFAAETVKLAAELGFDTVAVNVEVMDLNETSLLDDSTASSSSTQTPIGKKQKQQKRQKFKPIPPPFRLDPKHIDQTRLTQLGKKFRVYSRLTLGIDDADSIHNILKHPTVLQYDILAIHPKTEQIFNIVVNKVTEVDVIAVDMTQKNVWISKKNLVQMAVEKGITFEMTYAQALADSSVRREVFATGRDLFRATKGKGLMFNSRAERPIQLRSPYDVANLAILFGMTTGEGRRTISNAPKQLLLRAESKKSVKGVIGVQSCDEVVPDQLARLLKIPEFRIEIERVHVPLTDTADTIVSPSSAVESSPPKKRKKT